MFKVFRKLFYFLKNITIYILAGTGDWIGSVVFYGRPKRLKQIRRFFKQQSNRYIAFIDKKKEWQRVAKKRYKKLITFRYVSSFRKNTLFSSVRLGTA